MSSSSSDQGALQDLSFERAYALLEQVVNSLETGGLTLDEATDLYEQGVALSKRCNELLRITELRVTDLKSSLQEQLYQMSESAADVEDSLED